MGFVILSRDITKEKVDVIVNSLGIVTNHYGAICSSILNATGSKELKQIIDEKNGKVSVGDMFFTDSYGLPAKKILHLVTPFHKYDKEYTAFETAIRDILNLCRNSGYKSISIPILGTGANGYNPIEVQNILMAMCSGFADAYKEMNIRVIKKPVIITNQYNPDFDCFPDMEERRNHRDVMAFESAMMHYYKDRDIKLIREERDYDSKFFESGKPILPVGWAKENVDLNRKDITLTEEEKKKIKNIDDYIKTYLSKRYENKWNEQDSVKKRIKIYVGDGNFKQGSKYYYQMKTSEAETPNRLKMFKIVLALETSENEALDFLQTFGIYPSHKLPIEQCVMSCIRNSIYNMNSIDEELRRLKLGVLFI